MARISYTFSGIAFVANKPDVIAPTLVPISSGRSYVEVILHHHTDYHSYPNHQVACFERRSLVLEN
ncbi:hypothetical protein [Brevibacillus sp. NRS-1366]|uniref:hypothetical protein n=1 Tax=Brevibacillus sp. NRS-1366 TaxID=3233899 RepID=UPI003D1C504E